jgi:sirohydrochlorin ferrochelatase
VFDIARGANTGGPVEVAFLMGSAASTHRFQDVVRQLETARVSRIVVVPMLVSSYSGHYDQVRYLAGQDTSLDEAMLHHLQMAGIERPRTTVPIHLATALDAAPQVAHVLADRATKLATDPASQALMIVGHGPNSAEDYAMWMKNLRILADSVMGIVKFRDVRVDVVRDDAPPEVRGEAVTRVRELIQLQHMITGKPVVVVPILVSAGAISRDKLPADLQGMPIVYDGAPLLPHAAISRWVEWQVRTAQARR